jgi:hypothetical protein
MKHCPLGLWRLLVDSDDVGDYFLLLRRVLGDMQPLQLKESLLHLGSILLCITSHSGTFDYIVIPQYRKLSKSLITLVYELVVDTHSTPMSPWIPSQIISEPPSGLTRLMFFR